MTASTTPVLSQLVSVTQHSFAELKEYLDMSDSDMCEVAKEHGKINQEIAENTAEALEKKTRAYIERKRMYGQRFLELSAERARNGEKTGEATMDAVVRQDAFFVAAYQEEARTEAIWKKWEGLLDSFRERRNGYQEIGQYNRAGQRAYKDS